MHGPLALAARLRRQILARRWLTFIVMGVAFLTFGAGTLNLFFSLRANLALLADHGWQAIMDGGALQLIELLAVAFASLAAYLVFKTCEYALVRQLLGERDASHDPEH